jgi:NAD(P)-dependent dehydrogenase (short-subunit alcohol dehydrogenase family)
MLARRGYDVVLCCRDAERGEAEAARVRAAGARAWVESCDLAQLASVDACAARIRARGTIHVLVNNAGMVGPEAMAVNHLAHFLLTLRLLPVLAPDARVVHVASIAHATADLASFLGDQPRAAEAWPAYCASKAANVVFAWELARRLRASAPGVVSVAVHPGVLHTRLWRDRPFGPLQPCFNLCCAGKPQTLAAASVAYLATAARPAANGNYHQGCCCCGTVAAPPMLNSAALGPPLWAWSLRQLQAAGLDVSDLPAEAPASDWKPPLRGCGLCVCVSFSCPCLSCFC